MQEAVAAGRKAKTKPRCIAKDGPRTKASENFRYAWNEDESVYFVLKKAKIGRRQKQGWLLVTVMTVQRDQLAA